MLQHLRPAGRCMAVHNHSGQRAWPGQERLPDPQQVLLGLGLQGTAGANAGMGEQVAARGEMAAAAAKQVQIGGANPAPAAGVAGGGAVAFQGGGPSVGEPELDGIRRRARCQGVQHHAVVVAHQVEERQAARRFFENAENRRAVRATIHVVAEMQDQRVGDGAGRKVILDLPVQGGQAAGAAMGIADRVDPLPGRKRGGGWNLGG